MSIGHSPFNHDRKAPLPTQSHPHLHPVEEYEGSSPSPSEEIFQLARQISSSADGHIFNYEKGSILDPFHENFDSRLWISKFANLEDWALASDRQSGISFKDMTVFGYGTDAGKSPYRMLGWEMTDGLMVDYQKTVANIPLSWISAARTLIQGGRKRRVNILNSVDGVLEAGEMLVVLGPPGR